MSAVVQATAEARITRALESRTRPTAMLKDIAVGEQVEFYRKNPKKDETSWQGPATVVDTSDLAERGKVQQRVSTERLRVRIAEAVHQGVDGEALMMDAVE